MALSRLAASAAILALFSSSVAAQASDTCWQPEEREAAQLRALQSYLMVATMHCRTRYSFAVPAYNDFVTRQRAMLDTQGAVLKAHFVREEGPVGQAAYDRYNTWLANRLSEDFRDTRECWDVAALAKHASEANAGELLQLSSEFAPQDLNMPCRAAPAAVVAVAPVSAEVRSASAPVPVKVDMPPALIVVANAPPAPPAPAKVVLAAANPSEDELEMAAASPEDKLQAAILALQAATAALQAAMGAQSGPQTEGVPVAASSAPIGKPGALITASAGGS